MCNTPQTSVFHVHGDEVAYVVFDDCAKHERHREYEELHSIQTTCCRITRLRQRFHEAPPLHSGCLESIAIRKTSVFYLSVFGFIYVYSACCDGAPTVFSLFGPLLALRYSLSLCSLSLSLLRCILNPAFSKCSACRHRRSRALQPVTSCPKHR